MDILEKVIEPALALVQFSSQVEIDKSDEFNLNHDYLSLGSKIYAEAMKYEYEH